MIKNSTARDIELVNQRVQNNPFVAWLNLGATATLGGTAVLAGGERANAVTGSTYDKWRPNVTGTTAALSFDFGTSRAIGFAAIAAHNAETHAATVELQTSPDNSAWTTVESAVAFAGVMAFRVTGSARYWRFNFTGLTASDALSVGVAFMGLELIIPRRLYQGFAPIITPTEVQLQSNVSVGGELLGSSVITRGSTLSANITLVPPAFIRGADFKAFQTAFGEGKGFFFAWRPAKYPEDVHYCWRDGAVIRPDNSGPLDFMSLSINARAYNG
jgi:hypothetical protein